MRVRRRTKVCGEARDLQQCTTSTKMWDGAETASWRTRVTLIDLTEFELPRFKKSQLKI